MKMDGLYPAIFRNLANIRLRGPFNLTGIYPGVNCA